MNRSALAVAIVMISCSRNEVHDVVNGSALLPDEESWDFEPDPAVEDLAHHRSTDSKQQEASDAYKGAIATLSESLQTATDPSSLVSVVFQLHEVEFPFRDLVAADEALRTSLIKQREEQLRPHQARVVEQLLSAGATQVTPFWLTNSIHALLPRQAVERIAAHPLVAAVAFDANVQPLDFDGDALRTAIGATPMLSLGFDGNANGVAQRVGIIETALFPRAHSAFLTTAGAQRFEAVYDCVGGACALTASAENSTHGAWVSAIAMGSVEGGQDPATGGSAAIQRSGVLRDAVGAYFKVDSCASVVAAINTAVKTNVPIVNGSLSVASADRNACCSMSFDCAGLNATIKSATDSARSSCLLPATPVLFAPGYDAT